MLAGSLLALVHAFATVTLRLNQVVSGLALTMLGVGSWGLLRSVGESPETADALGVNVALTRYLAVAFGGALAGLGGAYLSVVYAPNWIEGMTAGAGWIVIALTIFAMWDPLRALLGAYLFGGVRVLQYRLQDLGVSPPLLNMLPFVFTILVLLMSAGEVMRKRIGAPAALMKPYSREER
jgi:simple sugar transport system permease protein